MRKSQNPLPDGWRWLFRPIPKRWAATRGAVGFTSEQFWCDVDGSCWDTCEAPIPAAVIIAVLKVNGFLT